MLIELPWADHAFDAVPFGPGAQIALYATERFLAGRAVMRCGRDLKVGPLQTSRGMLTPSVGPTFRSGINAPGTLNAEL